MSISSLEGCLPTNVKKTSEEVLQTSSFEEQNFKMETKTTKYLNILLSNCNTMNTNGWMVGFICNKMHREMYRKFMRHVWKDVTVCCKRYDIILYATS